MNAELLLSPLTNIEVYRRDDEAAGMVALSARSGEYKADHPWHEIFLGYVAASRLANNALRQRCGIGGAR